MRALNELEHLIISALNSRNGRSYQELVTLAAYSGKQMGPESINDLAARGLIRIDDDPADTDESTHLFLTEEGHVISDQLNAESQRIEDDMMQQLGVPETIALRTLLSRFVRIHSPLIPYRWF